MNLDLQSLELLTRLLGEVALISMMYGSICRLRLPAVAQQAAHGLLFGAAAIVTSLFPIAFSDSVKIDGHLMMLAHSAAFGGPITFLISAAISLVYKLGTTNSMVVNWLISAGATGVLALSWHYLVRPRGKLSFVSLIALGTMNTMQLLLFFFLPFDQAVTMIMRTLPVGLLIAVLGAVLMGKFIEREMRRLAVEDRLARDAQTDALTGLGNRRAFEIAMTMLEKSATMASALVLDIDHFKRVNDDHGHHTGDAVLRAVGESAARTIGKQGRVFRTGGEEFTVLLAGTEKTAAFAIAEDVRLAVADIRLPGIKQQVTVSVGVAQSDAPGSVLVAIRKADRALYLAKAAGRNRSIAAEEIALLEPEMQPAAA